MLFSGEVFQLSGYSGWFLSGICVSFLKGLRFCVSFNEKTPDSLECESGVIWNTRTLETSHTDGSSNRTPATQDQSVATMTTTWQHACRTLRTVSTRWLCHRLGGIRYVPEYDSQSIVMP